MRPLLRRTSGGDTFVIGGPLGATSRRNSNGITYYTRDPHGQLLDTRGAGGTYYYLLDRQGSTTALIDPTGHRAGSYTYTPYGRATPSNGSSTTAADTNPWRYTGGYQNPDDGYLKLGARYYDTAVHFTQPDPSPTASVDTRNTTATSTPPATPAIGLIQPDNVDVQELWLWLL